MKKIKITKRYCIYEVDEKGMLNKPQGRYLELFCDLGYETEELAIQEIKDKEYCGELVIVCKIHSRIEI